LGLKHWARFQPGRGMWDGWEGVVHGSWMHRYGGRWSEGTGRTGVGSGRCPVLRSSTLQHADCLSNIVMLTRNAKLFYVFRVRPQVIWETQCQSPWGWFKKIHVYTMSKLR
jgi:hypothetical protein